MNLHKTYDQRNKKNAIPPKERNIFSQNCLYIYRKILVSLSIAAVNQI